MYLTNGHCSYAAFPPGGDCPDGEGNTGELIGNNTPFVWNDELCDGSNPTHTWAQVLALYAGATIDEIQLVVDASGGPQTVTSNPCMTASDIG